MTPNKKVTHCIILILIYAFASLSCSDDDGDSTDWMDVSRSNTYSGSGSNVFLVETEGNVHLTYTLDLGSFMKNVYFIFTNTAFVNAPSSAVVHNLLADQYSHQSSSDNLHRSATRSSVHAHQPVAQRGKREITEFNHRPILTIASRSSKAQYSLRPTPLRLDYEGSTTSFYDESGLKIDATCRKVISKNSTNGIPVTVNIWVADNCWKTTCQKKYCVTQDMVNALANKFIQEGLNNDIYEWATAIFGVEWESMANQKYSNLISDTDEITILLFDIENDNSPTGGIVGFFYSRDNFFKESSDPILKFSNERLMFYLDAVMFANGGTPWNITNKWPSEIVSTLAHEFQHMIHFYQKTVLRTNGQPSETWIDELCSLVTEDILAYYMQVDGPRGVNYSTATAGNPYNQNGRLPEYNYYNDISLIEWYNSTPNYAIAYAFGAYLARNFGGARLLREIVQNSYTNYRAIEYALAQGGYSTDFATALRQWAAANLISDSTTNSSGYQYNKGDWFTSSLSGIEYKLGSINLYNYVYGLRTGPYVYTQIPVEPQPKISNLYYLAGTNKTGKLIFKIDLPKEIKLTVVVK
ncbi:MAG: peptidase M30 [Spirochaetes bacterium]|nr:peptidase M30 [Spirochaetota bacterium]